MKAFFALTLFALCAAEVTHTPTPTEAPVHTATLTVTPPPTHTPKKVDPKGCFSRTSLVTTAAGASVRMTDLKVGDRVVALGDDGKLINTPVIRVSYNIESEPHTFVRLTTSNGRSIEVTPRHYVFASACCNLASTGPKLAADVTIGETLFTVEGGDAVTSDVVTKIELVSLPGAINVHTATGTLVVNNVAATHFTDETSFGPAGRAYVAPMWYAFLHYVARPMGLGEFFGINSL